MKVVIESYLDGEVRVHLDLHNRNGSLDACANRKITANADKGWRNVALWALSYKGYPRVADTDLKWVMKTATEATFTATVIKGASKYERHIDALIADWLAASEGLHAPDDTATLAAVHAERENELAATFGKEAA